MLRFLDIAISEEALRDALGVQLDRFGLQRSGALSFAQINFPESNDPWLSIAEYLSRLGPSTAQLIATGAIGRATLDIAYGFTPNLVTHSAIIPSSIAEAAGRNHLDIEISTYPLNGD